jgi:hypothetical protein
MHQTIFPLASEGGVGRALAALRSRRAVRSWRARDPVVDLPQRIVVRASSSEAILRIRVRLHYQLNEEVCGVALFNLASWPFRGHFEYADEGLKPWVQGSVLRYPLAPMETDPGCVCVFEFEWQPGNGSSTLHSLDSLLPQIVLSDNGTFAESLALPKQEVAVAPSESIAVGVRVSLGSSEGGAPAEALTWVLMHPIRPTHVSPVNAGSSRPTLRVENALAELGSPTRHSELLDIIAQTAVTTSRLLGTAVPEPLMILLNTSDSGSETAGVVLFTSDQLRTADPYSVSYEAARQIASVSWGSACRAHGRGGKELEHGMAAAVAVRAADTVTGANRSSGMVTRFRARAIRTIPVQLRQRLFGEIQHRLAFQSAARMLALSLERGDTMFSIVTAQAWGQSLRGDFLMRAVEQCTMPE